MEITETDEYYVVSFFPNAEEVEIDDKPEKGYKAIIGVQDGDHVVMKVMYAKDRFNLDQVIDLAKNIKECPICKRLDAEVGNVKKISLKDNLSLGSAVSQSPSYPAPTKSKPEIFDTGNPLQDMMARIVFNTRLNDTGKVISALALEDENLMREVMPQSIGQMIDLVADLTEYTSGKGTIFKSPEDTKKYVQALREGNKTDKEKEEDKKASIAKKRAGRTIIIS